MLASTLAALAGSASHVALGLRVLKRISRALSRWRAWSNGLFPREDPWERIRMSETHREFHGLHVRFAESLYAQFERLWQRPLAPHERTIVSSYVTCVGFMLLEAVERELAHATSEGDAAEHFAHMEKEVGREGQRVLERMAAAAHVDPALLARESGGDLLRAEEYVMRLLGRELP